MKENANISLQLLLLNDLLRTKVIDKDMYDIALTKITSSSNIKTFNKQPVILATA